MIWNEIPVIRLNEFITTRNEEHVSCFYGFDDEDQKEKALMNIRDKMSGFNKFRIYHDFMTNLNIDQKTWSFEENVMIYENTNASDGTRLVSGGKGSYDCCLWMCAIIE